MNRVIVEIPEEALLALNLPAGGAAETLRMAAAKRAGVIPVVAPLLDQLDALRFRLAQHTRAAVLKLAGE